MPTYVYECSACKKVFEVEQRITEDALKDCSCGSLGTLKRLIQPIAVMFKGSGFHINDYAAKTPEESGSMPEKPAATPEAPKTETSEKPAPSTPAPTAAETPAAPATPAENKT